MTELDGKLRELDAGPAERVTEAASLAELAVLRSELPQVARRLLAAGCGARQIMECLTRWHLAIMGQAFAQGLARRVAAAGPPPARFCLMILGSAARREMLLAPDQDHALLYEELPPDRLAAAEAYFAPLAGQLVVDLEALGYPRCPGGVMADDPAWRGRPSDWQGRIREWLDLQAPRQLVNATLFFDMAPLAGEAALVDALRRTALEEVQGQSAFLVQLMNQGGLAKIPLGLFGRFLTERHGVHAGQISLKLGGSLQIVDGVRLFALDKGLPAIGTGARLEGLVAAHTFAARTARQLDEAFATLYLLRLRREIEQLDRGEAPGHHVAPRGYPPLERQQLHQALQAARQLQLAAKSYFSRSPF